jgi:beta-glucosidase/6-phospho-beta-glucosidase/beta-galactosidase
VPMLRAAQAQGVKVVWDLCHYGWPDRLDIWSARFVERFARFAGAVARLIVTETGGGAFYCPVNEISYWAWAGGDMAHFHPLARRRGCELKRQLVRASIAAIDAIREVDPAARFVAADPIIHVAALTPRLAAEAKRARLAQFEAWDMLCGRRTPELGGSADHLDILGLNFYGNNQWFVGGPSISPADAAFRPLRAMLEEVAMRYARPMFIAETGAEGSLRVPWLRYVADEVAAAECAGICIEGICLYPVLDYPGWSDERHCETGVLGHADDEGRREVYEPLAREIAARSARRAELAT